MGNISITIGDSTTTKDIDDIRLQKLVNLFSSSLQWVDGAAFADGGPPQTDKQKQRAAMNGMFDHMVNWARERRRQELAAEAAITLENELK
jgi:hypothetical protein